MTEINKSPKLDEILYSRQIYALGFDTMNKLVSSSVLISGMGGLGVEIAKNVILSGIGNVTIHDIRNTEINDLASNYYLSEKSIGKNRAVESFARLSNLNKNVNVCVKTDTLTNDLMKIHNCVVITDFHPESEIKKIASFCHLNAIKLIITETRGLFAYIFNDFGPHFYVKKPSNCSPTKFALNNVTQSNHGVVTISDYCNHELYDDDYVTFEKVEGMTELNGKEFRVKVIDKHRFIIGDTSTFNEYSSEHNCGYGKKVIVPKTIDFLEFTEALKKFQEKKIFNDNSTLCKDQQVLLAFIASQHFLDKIKRNTSEISSDELFESAKEMNSIYNIVENIDEKIIHEFARESRSVICPVCSIFGGIASQEIIKSISSNFVPINQFFSMEFTSSLPKDVTCELKNDRYDPYRIIFGNKQQEAMENLRYFIVGLGSIGCEQLKNFSMMGIASQNQGQIFTTDCKPIKKSNLSHQFLFNENDVGKMKSDVAMHSIHSINSNIHITSKQNEFNFDSTPIFNDLFFQKLDGICSAVDNIETRLFLDHMSVFYELPQIISKTSEMKASYQVVVPRITECYSDFPELSPTIHEISAAYNFPSTFDEICLWSSDMYSLFFETKPEMICKLFNNQRNIEKMNKNEKFEFKQALLEAKEFFIVEKCENFDDCINWARLKFEDLFNHRIKFVIQSYPEDKMSDNGTFFWSGKRKFPRPAIFDPNNENHAKFIKTAANLRAKICQIEPYDVDILQKAISIQIPDFEIVNKERNLNLKKNDINNESEENEIEKLYKEILPFFENSNLKLPKPETFLTDENDDNDFTSICFHFIQSTIKIRAFNYHIKTNDDDKFEIKKFLRKINPSVITTSSMISGLASLEMYKIHCIDNDKKKINYFRSGQIDFSSSSFCIFEPRPFNIIQSGIKNFNYSVWDKLIFKGNLTIDELMKEIYEKYELIVDFISFRNHIIYSSFNNNEIIRKRITTKIYDIITNEFSHPPLGEGQYFLEINCLCTDDDDNDVEMPKIYLQIKDH